jgi:hypothetical protein
MLRRLFAAASRQKNWLASKASDPFKKASTQLRDFSLYTLITSKLKPANLVSSQSSGFA